MTGDFSNGRAGTERWFFERAEPETREMSFLMAEYGYRKKKTNNLTSQSGLTKKKLLQSSVPSVTIGLMHKHLTPLQIGKYFLCWKGHKILLHLFNWWWGRIIILRSLIYRFRHSFLIIKNSYCLFNWWCERIII